MKRTTAGTTLGDELAKTPQERLNESGGLT